MFIIMSNPASRRQTSQRQIILDYLRGVTNHPTAEAIFQQTSKKLPHLSLGTVYRNLQNLVRDNLILEIPGEVSRYDADLKVHAHFICDQCGLILDIWDKLPLAKITHPAIGSIKSYQIYFSGFCQNCQNKLTN